MHQNLGPVGLLLVFTFAAYGQGGPLAAVVLRDKDPSTAVPEANGDEAILLDPDGNRICTISDLGVCQSISYQNKVLIDATRDRILIAENLTDRVSVFGYDGISQLKIPIENVAGIALSNDAALIGCLVGKTLDEDQTLLVDAASGTEVRRLAWGGAALTNDGVESQFWSVGRQLIAFSPKGDVYVRRPLTQLPAEVDHPTVINSRNWCGTGIAVQPNEKAHWRSIWVVERAHPNVKGSKNRLFAVDPEGQIRILVELQDVDPRSIACATYRSGRHDLTRIVVVDGATGNLVSYNSDGELMSKDGMDAHLIAFGSESGLWVAGKKFVRHLDAADLSVIAEYQFDDEANPIGLAVR